MGIFGSSSPRASAWAAPDLGVEAINPPLAPVRVAVPDGKGGVTLGFTTDAARNDALVSCATDVRARCLDGARYGCTLAAARACAPPKWKARLGLAPPADADAERRAACEAYHRHECARAALAACGRHAGVFCVRVVGRAEQRDEEEGGE